MANGDFGATGVKDKTTFIYGLIDPRSGQIRYIGKTVLSPERRLNVHLWRAREAPHKRHSMAWLLNVVADGRSPETVVLETIPPGGDWIEAEQFWISYFRMLGADLCNHTIGGEGQTGYRQPAEVIAKRIKYGPEHHQFGKPILEKTLRAMLDGGRKMRADPKRAAAANAKRIAGITREGKQRSIQALIDARADPEKFAEIEAKRLEKSKTDDSRKRVAEWSRKNWQEKRDAIIAAQNAGKGEEWRRKMSETKRREWEAPDSPHRLASMKQRKLSDYAVIDIKNRALSGESQRAIAREYGIDPSVVSHIKAGRFRYGKV